MFAKTIPQTTKNNGETDITEANREETPTIVDRQYTNDHIDRKKSDEDEKKESQRRHKSLLQ